MFRIPRGDLEVGNQPTASGLEDERALAIFLDHASIMNRHDHAAVLAPAEQLVVALELEATVADQNHLVDQVAFEVHRQRQREREPHAHAVGVEAHRHVHVLAELGELHDVVEGLLERQVVEAA